jgi:hypothetical protein
MSLDGYANFKTAIAEWADRADPYRQNSRFHCFSRNPYRA